MAYRKVRAAHAVSLEREALQASALDLDSNCANPDLDLEPIQPSESVSPHGRFERLQAPPKGQRRSSYSLVRYLLAGVGLFILGLLIGHYTHSTDQPTPEPPRHTDLLEELLRDITAKKIQALTHTPITPLLPVLPQCLQIV
ncbi:unnamed protein product, partial [Coregonus sp. 'balchen']